MDTLVLNKNLVVKIKYGNTLRRLTVPRSTELSYSWLEGKVRSLFQLPEDAPLSVTYVDNEQDVVTMGDDMELKDAVSLQGLNPLRLTVSVFNSEAPSRSVSVLQSMTSDAASDTSGTEVAEKHEGEGKVAEAIEDSKAVKAEEDVVNGNGGSQSAPADSGVDSKSIEEEIRNSLKAAWKAANEGSMAPGDIANAVSAFEPLFKVAPEKLAEVVEAAMRSGFSASFETSFTSGEEDSTSKGTQTPPSNAVGEKLPVVADTPPAANGKVAPESASGGATASAAVEDSAADRVFHNGVQCDVCGMSPIVGPRYKSTVKLDYDLCRSCYAKQGVEGEYNKIERPLYRPRHHPFWAHGGHPQGRMGMRGPCAPCGPSFGPGGPGSSFGGRPFYMGRTGGCGRTSDPRFTDGKLDARFVKDVTIFDGTELPPFTPFTKIWRLRNNGTLSWPQHTRLVHVGGDHCGQDDFVSVHVPEEGLEPGQEVEVGVDLVAPEQPGRYVSHWRLMAPGGKKFGHRVWSLIQVVPLDEPSPQMAESVATSDASQQSAEADAPAAGPSAPAPVPAPAEASVGSPDLIDLSGPEQVTPATAPPLEVVTTESSAPEEAVEQPPAPVQVATPESPKVEDTSVGDFSLVEHPTPGDNAIGVVVTAAPEEVEVQETEAEKELPTYPFEVPVYMAGGEEGSEEEEAVVVEKEISAEEAELASLLNQLEAMGFADRNMNVDLLKDHSLDLQATLDELVAMSEWDHMLDDLHDMGFDDDSVNRRLMRKNKGSVKHVVKDLVAMYRGHGNGNTQ